MKKKSKQMMVLVMAVVAVVSVGATLALSQALTNQEINNFMVKNPKSFVARLYEPLFKDDATQRDKALKMAPGSVVAKNPYIQNESVDHTIGWAAMRIVVTTDGSTATPAEMAIINKVFEADWNTTRWSVAAGTTANTFNPDGVYYYDTKLIPLDDDTSAQKTQCKTLPIFTQVKVKDNVSEDDLEAAALLGAIDIRIVGMTLDEQYGATLDQTVKDYLKVELDKYVWQ